MNTAASSIARASRVVVVALALFVSACTTLPSLEGRSETHAIADTRSTQLGRAVMEAIERHPARSGIYALTEPMDAFAARAILASLAEKSLDIQYYIWHADQTGLLLFEAAWRAADRGVRVRILLDDANTGGEDAIVGALDAHPNIEVRLYNPFVPRAPRVVDLLTDFGRVNRRMHNKSFTADNQVTIVGGRNIGNEYFGAGNAVAFTDLDVLAVGAAVPDVSNEFDLYWNSASAYPATRLVATPSESDARSFLAAKFAAVHSDPAAGAYVDALRRTRLVEQLLSGKLPLDWVSTQVVRDDPAKTLDTNDRADVLLLTNLLPAIGRPNDAFDLVSPYFVPAEAGTAALAQAARRGVRVRVLTNSLAATDVAAVHAGYVKRRCELLRAGVHLYEFEPSSRPRDDDELRLGSSGSVQLHAKTFQLDRDRIFVGSFNFDPRSARLNTEMGLLIESPSLASRLAATFDEQVPKVAYEVRLAADGRCAEWIERTPAGEVRYETDPKTSPGRRAWIDFLSILPIDWLL